MRGLGREDARGLYFPVPPRSRSLALTRLLFSVDANEIRQLSPKRSTNLLLCLSSCNYNNTVKTNNLNAFVRNF